jgi:hypothetical protein
MFLVHFSEEGQQLVHQILTQQPQVAAQIRYTRHESNQEIINMGTISYELHSKLKNCDQLRMGKQLQLNYAINNNSITICEKNKISQS